jgi:IS1 family transposase
MYITGLKKTAPTRKTNYQYIELDELYWFVEHRPRTKTHENIYIIAAISREPRQIVSITAARDKSVETIQKVVDSAPLASYYCTDGYQGYLSVAYFGEHIYNKHDKSDTHNVESVNADLRHYIPILRRRSRCFARKIETLNAVLDVFSEAYNLFGEAKLRWRANHEKGEIPFSVLDFL